MSNMTRSKTQVMRNYLPDQCFQHENGVIVKVARVETSPANVNEDLLRENFADRLSRWQVQDDSGALRNRAPGFVDPMRHLEHYVALEPDGEVLYYVWPLVLRCRNMACAKIAVFHTREAWRNAQAPERCDKCQALREQLPYLMVHGCGRDADLSVSACDVHDMDHVYLEDSGSFETSQWRCRAPGCNGRVIGGMRYRACSCGEPGPYISMTIRQNSRFLPQSFSFVSFDRAPLARLRDEPGSDRVIVGSYLGLFDDFERALEDARKERTGDPAVWQIIEQALRKDSSVTDEVIAKARRDHFGEAGDAFRELLDLVDEDVIQAMAETQGARERTLVFGGAGDLRVSRLTDFRNSAQSTGRHGAVARLDQSAGKLTEYGFSDLLVVENFPVALAAYGYTRVGRHPRSVLLRPFPSPRQGRYRDKTPIYVSKSQTEAVFFELDARRVITWLINNQLHDFGSNLSGLSLVQAKARLLDAMHRNDEVEASVSLLMHTISHALIRNLGERSGFGEETMAEYLIPQFLTLGLFADLHQEFSLGALVSLVEHRLAEWLDATRGGTRNCAWDPQCARVEGACASCLHIAFGCEGFNGNLDRAVLFGSPEGHAPLITHGYWV